MRCCSFLRLTTDLLPYISDAMSGIRTTRQALIHSIPRAERGPSKSERTRDKILASALDFLWTHPFRELTVGELMSATDVSRSAFYQYFRDLHEMMETLLVGLETRILDVAQPWFLGGGDPVEELKESLRGLVEVCYQHGPVLRAVSEAAAEEKQLEKAWNGILGRFDDAVVTRIEHHQAAGLIRELEARPIAVALNRMNAYVLIHAFGRRPRQSRDPVIAAVQEIWCSTLFPELLERER
jgi:AcrR family transcriptional regulator